MGGLLWPCHVICGWETFAFFVHEKISDVFVITWIRKLRFYKLVSLLFVNLRAFTVVVPHETSSYAEIYFYQKIKLLLDFASFEQLEKLTLPGGLALLLEPFPSLPSRCELVSQCYWLLDFHSILVLQNILVFNQLFHFFWSTVYIFWQQWY